MTFDTLGAEALDTLEAESVDSRGAETADVRGAVGEARGVAVVGQRQGAAVDATALRRAFRRHAAGVTVVTMAGPRGPVGFTATSVASLSADPPLLSLSLSASSSSAPALLEAPSLVVHLLSDGQQGIAARFATSGIDRFAAPTRWRPLPTGEPLLVDASVWLRTRILSRLSAGDHHLVIAEVVETRVDSDPAAPTAPLVYHDGGYGTVTPRASG